MDPITRVGGNGGPISTEFLQEKAAERELPPGMQQRRDSQGQFQSHKDLPDENAARSFSR